MPDRGGELVDLFVRDLDQIELPPRDRWRPAPRKESIFMRTSRTILYAGAVAAVLAVALIAGLALRDGGQVAATPPVSATSTPPPATSAPATTASPTSVATASPGGRGGDVAPTAQSAGTITGALGYPSNFVPPLTIYAISVADQRLFFSVDTPRFGGDPNAPPASAVPGATPVPRPSYTITGVAPGTYYVLAYRNDDVNVEAKNSPGVYSQYVVGCIQPTEAGARPAACEPPGDHSLVQVTVRPGETVSRVDITDWYYQQQQNYPARPR